MEMERRSLRSRAPALATRQYLLSVARRHQPRAILVTDLEGNVVAGVEGRPFMETGFVATRASQRVERALVETALVEVTDDGAAETKGLRRLLARPKAKVRRWVRLARLWLARRERPEWLAATQRCITRIEVEGRQLLVVVAGDGPSAGAATPETLRGLQRILASA